MSLSRAGKTALQKDQNRSELLSTLPNGGPGAHVCVAGRASSDAKFLDALGDCGRLTLVRDLDLLWPSALLSSVAVLALDMGVDINGGLALVGLLTEAYPALRIVVINGRLSQNEIAEAFQRGACDYFAASSCRDLVVERLVWLSRQRMDRAEEIR